MAPSILNWETSNKIDSNEISESGRVYFDACAGYYLTIINDLSWNFSFYGSWDSQPSATPPKSDYAPVQVLAGPSVIDEDIQVGVLARILEHHFLCFFSFRVISGANSLSTLMRLPTQTWVTAL